MNDKLKLHLRSLLLEDLLIKQYMYDKAFDTYIEYSQSHICDSMSEDLRQDMIRTRDSWRKAKEMLKAFDTAYG